MKNPNPDQLWLDGLMPSRPAADNLFFAVRPDRSTAERVLAVARMLRRAHGLGGEPLKPENLHVTLAGLTGYSDRQVKLAQAMARSIVAPPIETVFDQAMSFRRNNALVLCGGDKGLVALRRQFMRGGTPHMTLLYDRAVVEPQPIPPIRWIAQEFVLVHSLVGLSTHRVLGRWRLAG